MQSLVFLRGVQPCAPTWSDYRLNVPPNEAGNKAKKPPGAGVWAVYRLDV